MGFEPPLTAFSSQLPAARSGRTIAIICDTVPYPTRSGDNQRIAELISVLKERGWYVHLILCGLVERRSKKLCASRVDALHIYSGIGFRTRIRNWARLAVRWFDRAGKRFGVPPLETIVAHLLGRALSPRVIDYWQRYPVGLSEFVGKLQDHFAWNAVIVEYIWLYRSVDHLKNGTVRLLDTHDLQHKRVEEFASRGLMFPLSITRDEEKRIFERFDAVIAIQAAEAKLIQEMCPKTPVLTVGWSGSAAASTASPPTEGPVLYVGGYNGANLDGLRRFLDVIWPDVLRQIPGVALRVCGHVGRGFTRQSFDNVCFLGHQESLDEEYAKAAVVINPVWIGTGLKIKTIEALSRGKPLVTTPKGVEGLPQEVEESAFVAKDDKSFADALIGLLSNEAWRRALSCSALAFAHRHLNKQAVYKELFQFLQSAS
jgi:glycosyltransferase involved in cell wall biosynthesis